MFFKSLCLVWCLSVLLCSISALKICKPTVLAPCTIYGDTVTSFTFTSGAGAGAVSWILTNQSIEYQNFVKYTFDGAWAANSSLPFVQCRVGGVNNKFCYDQHLLGNSTYIDGSTEYCHYYNCTTGAVCSCDIGSATAPISHYFANLGIFKNVTSVTSLTPLIVDRGITYNATIFSSLVNVGGISARAVESFKPVNSAADYYVHLDDDKLDIVFSSAGDRQVYLLKDEWTYIENTVQSELHLILPPEAFVVTGPMKVTIFEDGDVVFVTTVEIIGVKTCAYYDCYRCWHIFTNLRCMGWFYQMLFICFAIIVPLGTFVFCVLCLLFLLWCVKCGFRLCYGCATCSPVRQTSFTEDLSGYWSSLSGKTKSYFFTKKQDESQSPFNIEEHGGAREIPVGTQKLTALEWLNQLGLKNTAKASFIVCCIAICFIGSTDAEVCKVGYYAATNFTSCISSGQYGTQNCKTQFQQEIVLPTVGSSACLYLKDAVSGQVYQQITIEYTYATDTIQLVKDYNTADFVLQSESIFRCYGTTNCKSTKCDDLDELDMRTAYGELINPLVINYPGESRCQRQIGTLNTGTLCLLPVNGCLFYGYSLLPTGAIWDVYKFGNRRLKPTLTITTLGPTKPNDPDVVTMTTDSYFDAHTSLNFEFIGLSYVPPDQFGGKNKVVSQGTTFYLATGSEAGIPEAGKIGDIQGTTASNLNSTGADAFIYDPSIVYSESFSDSHGVSFQYKKSILPNIASSGVATPIPFTFNTNRWFMSEGDLISNLANAPALTFTISSDKTFEVELVNNPVCPKIVELVEVSGCYNCTQGANVILSAYSTCSDGFAAVTSSDSQAKVGNEEIILQKSKENINITIFTNKKILNTEIQITTPRGSDKITVTATLSDPLRFNVNQTGNNNVNTTGGNEPTDGGGSIDLGKNFIDFFTGGLNWETYLITGFALLVVGIFAISSIVAGCYLLYLYLQKKGVSCLVGGIKSKMG